MEKIGLALDIGASNLRACTFDKNFNFLKLIEEKSNFSSKKSFFNQIKRIIKSLNFNLKTIGISSFGPLNIRKKYIYNAPNIKIKGKIEIGKFLNKIGYECNILNDCDCAVLAEKLFNFKKCENIVYVTFSSGIGVGAIINNKLLIGKSGNATEFGHIPIKVKEKVYCGCGKVSHWEAFCGGKNMEKLFYKKFKFKFSTEQIFKNYNKNPFKKFVDEIMEINAMGIATIINVLEPEILVIGGAVALNNKRIFSKLERLCEDYLINKKPKFYFSKFGNYAPLKGACLLSFNNFNFYI